MHILNFQGFIDQKQICRTDGCSGFSSRPSRRKPTPSKHVSTQSEGQIGIKLKAEFGCFSVQLPDGDEVITYDDGRVELKSSNGKTTPIVPSKKVTNLLIK